MRFRCSSASDLCELLRAAKESVEIRRRWLEGYRNDRLVAEFYGDSFRIVNGEEILYEGRYSTDGLRYNKAYAEFLFSLDWWSSNGWINPLLVLAREANDETQKNIKGFSASDSTKQEQGN